MPEITPAPLNVKPVGNVPETRLYVGAGRPFATSVYEYGVPTTPLPGVCAENDVGAPLMVIVNGVEPSEPEPLLACTVIGP